MDVVQFNNTINDAIDTDARRRFWRKTVLVVLVILVVVAVAGVLLYLFYFRGTGEGNGDDDDDDDDSSNNNNNNNTPPAADTGKGTTSDDSDKGVIIASSVGGFLVLAISGAVWYAQSKNKTNIRSRPRVTVARSEAGYRVGVPVVSKPGPRGKEKEQKEQKEAQAGQKQDLKADLNQALASVGGGKSLDDKAAVLLEKETVGPSGEVYLAVIPDDAPKAAVAFLLAAQARTLQEIRDEGGRAEGFAPYTSGMEDALGFKLKADPRSEEGLEPKEKEYRKRQRENMRLLIKVEGQARIVRIVVDYFTRSRSGRYESDGNSPLLLLANISEAIPLELEGMDHERIGKYVARYHTILNDLQLSLEHAQQAEQGTHKGDDSIKLTPLETLVVGLSGSLRMLYALEEEDDFMSRNGTKKYDKEGFEDLRRKLYRSFLGYYDEVVKYHGEDLSELVKTIHEKKVKRGVLHFRGLTVFGSGMRSMANRKKVSAEKDVERFTTLVEYFRRRANANGEDNGYRKLEGFNKYQGV